ncbi:hypothetical protein V6N13_040223 [Hibiscus sabdariffa]
MSAIPCLIHVDLSNNQLNGTVSKFLAELKGLKVGGNSNLCYNHSVLSLKLKFGVTRCDKHGLPVSPPPSKESSVDSQSDSSD